MLSSGIAEMCVVLVWVLFGGFVCFLFCFGFSLVGFYLFILFCLVWGFFPDCVDV